MKLLFDNNLSPRLSQRLADVFPGATHVSAVGLDRAGDIEVLEYASRKADIACPLVLSSKPYPLPSCLPVY
jgi:predicted nuclease of predicted toxin-antitoxin system